MEVARKPTLIQKHSIVPWGVIKSTGRARAETTEDVLTFKVNESTFKSKKYVFNMNQFLIDMTQNRVLHTVFLNKFVFNKNELETTKYPLYHWKKNLIKSMIDKQFKISSLHECF